MPRDRSSPHAPLPAALICRASDADRAKFVDVSNRVRGGKETADLLAEAREMFVEMKKRGEI